MIFDILLGRTRWELYRIVEHFEKEFSHDDKFRKNDPEKCSLSSYFSRRIKKDPINKYAYELLEKRVNQVYNQIQFDEKKVKRQINEEVGIGHDAHILFLNYFLYEIFPQKCAKISKISQKYLIFKNIIVLFSIKSMPQKSLLIILL